MHFPEKDKIFSELEKLLPYPTKLIVGVSGGPDSRLAFALLEEFYQNKGRDPLLLIVAHFNHGQRKESNKEQQQMFKWYENYHIYYNDKKPMKGLKETSLRLHRKNFFEEICQKEKAIYLATGHHLDDRIETSFINILRGTSLSGLTNMSFSDYRDGIFHIRPLISLQKTHIQHICDRNKIVYFLDPTNNDSSLTIRNALRNNIFPQLRNLSSQDKWYDSWSMIYTQLEKKYGNSDSNRVRIKPLESSLHRDVNTCFQVFHIGKKLSSYNTTDRIYIFQQLGIRKNVSQKTLAEWVRFSSNSADGYKFLAGFYFFISHGKVFAIEGAQNFWETYSDISKKIPLTGKTILFEGIKLTIKPLWNGGIIRYAKPGDVFKGKRVKKRMLNEKIPFFWRNFIPVIEKNGKIIEVVKDVVPIFYLR